MKKAIVIICILLLLFLLVPQKHGVNDGGTKIYESVVYTVYVMHRIESLDSPDENGKITYTLTEGIIVEILGHEVYNNTYITYFTN